MAIQTDCLLIHLVRTRHSKLKSVITNCAVKRRKRSAGTACHWTVVDESSIRCSRRNSNVLVSDYVKASSDPLTKRALLPPDGTSNCWTPLKRATPETIHRSEPTASKHGCSALPSAFQGAIRCPGPRHQLRASRTLL